MAPSRYDWKIVDWDVKPQHNQPTKQFIDYRYSIAVKIQNISDTKRNYGNGLSFHPSLKSRTKTDYFIQDENMYLFVLGVFHLHVILTGQSNLSVSFRVRLIAVIILKTELCGFTIE